MTDLVRRWLPFARLSPRPSARLFCFAHAGGSASLYRGWPDTLPPSIDLCPVELPGHGTRADEPAIEQMAALVQATRAALEPLLDARWAFFGHSMGAVVALELARSIGRAPVAAFVSSSPAPHLVAGADPTTIDDAWVADRLRDFDGAIDPRTLGDVLREQFLRLMRADFRAYYGHRVTPVPPLDCPLAAFGGRDDRAVSLAALEAWRAYTTGGFSVEQVPGNHFHVVGSRRHLTAAIAGQLLAAG
jgi:medium-chain acyl-[acyl-carrier-protein] hydrolase